MAIQLEKRLLNADEYQLMSEAGILKPSDKVELINGEIIKMSPIGSRHAAVVDRINRLLHNLTDEQSIVRVQAPIVAGDMSQPEPDISILKSRDDFYATQHPRGADIYLVIEVTDTTYDFDESVKSRIYAEAGIPEFWLVDLRNDLMEIKSQPENGIYKQTQLLVAGDAYQFQLLGFQITINDLIG
ncbi:MAG: Uma2 family endonuclease [Marinoscillum sp.]